MNEQEIGDALLEIIQEAINHERTKKRRRMAPDPDTAPLSSLRVYKEVSAAVQRIKITRLPPRPIKTLRHLEHLRDTHRAGTLDASSIDSWAWPMLGVGDEYERDELLRDPAALTARLEEAVATYRDSPEYRLDRRGGRVVDYRLVSFVNQLAFIYRAFTGYRATYSEARDSSGQQSHFFRFIGLVLRDFFEVDKDEEAVWATRNGAIQLAIRQISAFERDSEPTPE